MPSQSELIGDHPADTNIFGRWLACNDVAVTATKCHRSLTNSIVGTDTDLINWLAEKLIKHHYDESRLNRLKEKYREAGFPQYAEEHRKLPRADKTKKGNATEILLSEYIESCQKKALVKIYRHRYNPNVDQSMKGDDVLMVDLFKTETGRDSIKIFLGEAKFRGTPTKVVIDEITQSLSREKKPLSYSFLVDELNKKEDTKALADILDGFIIDEIKSRNGVHYAGMLLSNRRTFQVVESNLTSDNPLLVFISAGIDDPDALINAAYAKAEALVLNPI
jgi:hypothetical protein